MYSNSPSDYNGREDSGPGYASSDAVGGPNSYGVATTSGVSNFAHYQMGNCAQWIAQKYMERPQVIYDYKFDIRQWVLVTDWNPLTVYIWRQPYLRF